MRCLDIARSGTDRAPVGPCAKAMRAGSPRSRMEPPRATAALPEHVMDAGRLRRSHGAHRDRRRGVAAGKAAETLRKDGYDGDVTIVTAEPHPPYQRPPLSKGYLAGKEGLDAAILHPAAWYAERDIELRMSTTATRLDPAAHRLETDGGRTRLRRACCSRRARRRGSFRSRGTTSRASTRSDASTTRTRWPRELRGGGRRLVLIGSGWIGMEVAATARTLGNEVTILERDPVPLALAVGPRDG